MNGETLPDGSAFATSWADEIDISNQEE